MTLPNLVVFGETAVGKSSIVNLLADANVADTSNGAKGCTFESKAYEVSIDGTTFRIHDTVGLEEGKEGTVVNQEALVKLYGLLRNLDDGVSLLIFCMRGTRIKDSCARNWQFFWDIICQRRVPILLVITGLEHEENMDPLWEENQESFTAYLMWPNSVACITSIRGKKRRNGSHMFDEEYEESQRKMKKSIQAVYRRDAWKVERAEWFKTIVETSSKSGKWGVKEIKTSKVVFGKATNELVQRGLMEPDEAEELAQLLTGWEETKERSQPNPLARLSFNSVTRPRTLRSYPRAESRAAIPNVVIFGEIGTGKSSVVNLLADADVAQTSSRANGCTFQSDAYDVLINGKTFRIHDTAGLDEGQEGTVDNKKALVQLYELLLSLNDGVSLLIFCMRGTRIKDSCIRNWQLFWDIVCQRHVPILLAITGLESEEEDADALWEENEALFTKNLMWPNGVACIMATKGKIMPDGSHMFDDEYEESQRKMRKAIQAVYRRDAWKVERTEWLKTIVETSYLSGKWGAKEIKTSKTVFGSATNELIQQKLMEPEEAEELARLFKDL